MARWKVNGGCLGVPFGWLLVSALGWSASSLSAQELPLKREVPGSGPYQCPAVATAARPGAEEQRLARQLASTAAQAVILGDLDRARTLLDQATQLDPASADLAYRRARVLEELDQPQAAVSAYCKVLAVDSLAEGVNDARQRLDSLVAAERAAIPESAVASFREGLTRADAGHLDRALASLDSAVATAPEWPAAVYDRGVVFARMGKEQEATRDLRKYLELEPGAPDAMDVSRRIGELQSLVYATTPNPDAALFLGMLVPGMGQFYSGSALGGLTVLTMAGGAVAAGYFIKKVDVQCLSDPGPGGTCPPNQIVSEDVTRPYLTVSVEAAAAVTLVGAVLAFMNARQRRSAQQQGVVDLSSARSPHLAPPAMYRRGRGVDVALVRVVF